MKLPLGRNASGTCKPDAFKTRIVSISLVIDNFAVGVDTWRIRASHVTPSLKVSGMCTFMPPCIRLDSSIGILTVTLRPGRSTRACLEKSIWRMLSKSAVSLQRIKMWVDFRFVGALDPLFCHSLKSQVLYWYLSTSLPRMKRKSTYFRFQCPSCNIWTHSLQQLPLVGAKCHVIPSDPWHHIPFLELMSGFGETLRMLNAIL